ncbi:MAG: hypothetical protein J5680_01100 [Neisseriaceae bacterium]|nr:hypothetical protein [Neisseriaceae bacterium]
MTEEENPYAPPKSTDFRLPEQSFLPTKGQRITRIVLGTLLVPLLMVVELFLIVGDEYREIADIPFLLLFLIILIVVYILTIVQSFLFAFVLEKYCPSIFKKIMCIFVFTLFIVITLPFIIATLLPNHSFSRMAIGAFMTALPATMMTALILHAHYKYYEKKYLKAA